MLKRDFTWTAYRLLLSALKQNGYVFQTYEKFIQSPQNKVVILRHDVDLRAANSLYMAKN